MKFDNIIANPPYAKIGCDITKKVIEQNPDSNYAMLGTRSMFQPFYADTLACQFVQIGRYELGSNVKLDWGVEQAILLATNGWTEVVDNRKKGSENKVGIGISGINRYSYSDLRTTHLVGIEHLAPTCRCFQQGRISHLVDVSIQTTSTASVINKDSFLTETDKDVPPSTCNDRRDYNLRSGYLYVSFETFEEACECAIDIIGWTNPTDSHYRCVKWGFVTGLQSHERYKEEGD